MFTFVCLLVFIFLFYRFYQYFFPIPNINSNNKYVLISGCDTGVGHTLAIRLDQQGFHVFAGVLLHDNIVSLKNKLSSKATVFHLDITNSEHINDAFELVKSKTDTLHALVNNAGIITHGCIDWIPLELLRKIMNVNFFGHIEMTKRFLPLLIRKRYSRVVNMCSSTSLFRFPNTSAYSASKSAFQSFSDCLRREMCPWNLHVSIIEPGTLRTTMTDGYEHSWRNLWHNLSDDIQQRWGIDYLNSVVNAGVNSPFIKHADDPLRVVHAIEHAVTSTKPCVYYRPGWQAKVIYVFYWLPTWLSDFILRKAMNFIPADVQTNQLSK